MLLQKQQGNKRIYTGHVGITRAGRIVLNTYVDKEVLLNRKIICATSASRVEPCFVITLADMKTA